MEGVEVVDPSHRQDVAPGLTGRAGRNEGGVGCQADRRVPGAVDETGLVATFLVREGRLLGGQHRDVGDGSGGGPRVIERHVGCAAADPQPGIVLGRGGAMTVRPDDLGERTQRGRMPSRVQPHARRRPRTRRRGSHHRPTRRASAAAGTRAPPPWRSRHPADRTPGSGGRGSLREDPELREGEAHQGAEPSVAAQCPQRALTSAATARGDRRRRATSSSFRHWVSSSISLPTITLANPHCGLIASRSMPPARSGRLLHPPRRARPRPRAQASSSTRSP